MLNHRVGRRVSVSQEDQFQRNGVILDQRSGVWNDDTGAVSRGGAGGFTGIFEIVAADKARVGRVKRRPLCEPYLTLGTLAAPIYLATLPAQGANGPESHGQPRVRH
jgi:hypothetical protein